MAQTGTDPAAALELAIASAEESLQQRDLPAADRHSGEALLGGWVLRATVERVERGSGGEGGAVRNPPLFGVEPPPAPGSLAPPHLQLGEPAPAVRILKELAGKDTKDV